jgi:hypothetical protein
MDSSLEFKERKYRIVKPGSDVVRNLYQKKEEPKRERSHRREMSHSLAKKGGFSSSRERDKKTRIQRLTMISSDSSVLSRSDNGLGGSQGSIKRKTLETYGRYFKRSRSNQVNSRKMAQTGRAEPSRRLVSKRNSSKSIDRKRNKSVTSKKKKN